MKNYDELKNLLENLCDADSRTLKASLISFLKKYYPAEKIIIDFDNYIVAEGDIPVALVAHVDTVFSQGKRDEFYWDKEYNIVWSPAGAGFDDRAGIAAIISVVSSGFRPHIIFTDGEEKGGIGAAALVKKYPNGLPFKNNIKFFIELDRQGSIDSVFYCCENRKFEKFINHYGFKTDWGTFTDISVFMPAWNICGVNLSVGYYEEHSYCERLDLTSLANTIEKVKKILKKKEYPSFTFKQRKIARMYQNFTRTHGYFCALCDNEIKDISTAQSYNNGGIINYVCEDCCLKYHLN